jgi:chromosomal replication initiation ATPase DnaA
MGPIERELVQRYDAIHSNLVNRTRPRNQILIRQSELDQLRWDIFNARTKIEKLLNENNQLKETAKRFRLSYPSTVKAIHKIPTISTDKRYPKLERITELVAIQEGIGINELKSPRKQVHLVFARQIVFYLAKTLTMLSFPAIARQIGGRDHSTVIHGYRKMLKQRELDQQLNVRLSWYQETLLGEINGTPERSDAASGDVRRDNIPAAEGPQEAIGPTAVSL